MPPDPDSGYQRLTELARALPGQFRSGFRAGRSVRPVPALPARVVLLGMGGSAIAGDLACVLTDPETRVALSVVRGPELPRSVDRTVLALAASYSGNTEETLDAFEEAGTRGVPRIALTSGGQLADRARREGVPVIMIPEGGPPRAWVGFTLGAVLGILDPAFRRSNGARVDRVSRELEGRIDTYASRQGAPERWARRIGNRRVVLYAESAYQGLALRWKCQVEENAKRPAESGTLPEIFHNTLVAWDAAGTSEGRYRAVLQFASAAATTAEERRLRYLAGLLRARGVPVVTVRLPAEERLAALLHGIALGDFFTLALARRAGIDPLPIDAIDRMKARLSRGARTPSGPRRAPTPPVR